jgi:hypothetical protein
MAIGVPMLFNFLLFTAFMTMVKRQMDQQKDLWRAELGSAKSELREEIRSGFAEMRVLIEKNHSEMLSRFTDNDARLTRLENERRILQ